MDIAKCTFCGKEFKKKKYLNRHLKEVHKKNADGKPLSKSVEKSVQCVFCGKTFSRLFNLQEHTKVHFKKSADIFRCPTCKYSSLKKSNLKRHILKCRTKCGFEGTAEKNFKCTKCSANYKNKSSLRRHEQKSHKIRKQNNLMNRRKCPLCSFDTSDHQLQSMYIHFENAHNISLKWENYSFGSLDEFYDWKRHMEKITVSSFVTSKKYKNSTTFQCRRCGVFKPKGKNMRHMKIMGSCKIGGFCPGSIKIKVKNDCVTAVYQSIHVGHKNELKHVRLSKEERIYLASKLAEKVPHKEILLNIHESLSSSDLQRIHLIDKKDLANIERDFNLNKKELTNIERDFNLKHETMLQPYDPVSYESLVLNLNKSNDTALVFNKPQGEMSEKYSALDDNEFFLVFMTAAQYNAYTKLATGSSEKSGNTNVVKQRHVIAPLKTKTKKEILSKEEIQRISLDLLIETPDMSLHSEMDQMEPGTSSDHTYCKLSPADEAVEPTIEKLNTDHSVVVDGIYAWPELGV